MISLHLTSKKLGYSAIAEYDESTKMTIVKKGSIISDTVAGGAFRSANSVLKLRTSGVVVDNKLVADVSFKSPSSAANFVTGRSTNGNLAWTTEDGKKLGALLKG